MRFIDLDDNLYLKDVAILDELKNYKYEYASEYKTYLLLKENSDEIVGQVNFLTTFYTADILYIYINEEYRGQSLSKDLLALSFEELKKKGIYEVFLEVNETNNIALNLYLKMGFLEISRRKKYYDQNDAIIMKKDFRLDL